MLSLSFLFPPCQPVHRAHGHTLPQGHRAVPGVPQWPRSCAVPAPLKAALRCVPRFLFFLHDTTSTVVHRHSPPQDSPPRASDLLACVLEAAARLRLGRPLGHLPRGSLLLPWVAGSVRWLSQHLLSWCAASWWHSPSSSFLRKAGWKLPRLRARGKMADHATAVCGRRVHVTVSGDLEAMLDGAVASGVAVPARHLILDALRIACPPVGNWGPLFSL